MFRNHLPKRAGYCKSNCTLKHIFNYIGGGYPCDITKTFILVWVNKHHHKSAIALFENFDLNHSNWLFGGLERMDFYFPGFKNPFVSFFGDKKFNVLDFVKSVKEMENMSKWRYSGNTEFLFLEYINGEISFEHTISLNIDELLQNNTISSVSVLMEDIIKISKSCTQVSEFASQLNYLEASISVKDLS